MGLFSSKKTTNVQETNLTDNRLVTDANSLGNTGQGAAVGGMMGLSGGSSANLIDTSDNSFSLSAVNTDSRSFADNSSRTDSRQFVDSRQATDNRSWTDSRAWSDASQEQTSINITDGGIIASAFDYLKTKDASGAKQIDAMLNTSRSAVDAAMKSSESADTQANKTMIYALAAVAAVLIFKAA